MKKIWRYALFRRLRKLIFFALLSTHLYLHGSQSAWLDSRELFRSGMDGYNNIRIPALCVTTQGTLLAFAEGREGGDAGDIDLILRRSEDGGESWSQVKVVWDDGANTCGNPSPVVDRETGIIWLFMTWNLGSDGEREIMNGESEHPRLVWLSRSEDDGRTWSRPKEMPHLRELDWRWYATGPCSGIQLERGLRKRRLVVPANHSVATKGEAEASAYRSHVIYSDDHGETWELGGIQEPLTNESSVAELADGRVMQNMRSYHGKGNRAVAVSEDGGQAFGEVYLDDGLESPVCQGHLLRYSWPEEGRSRLLFSSPAGSERSNLTIRTSYDEGRSWSMGTLIYEGPSAYSNLARLPNGRVGLLAEVGVKNPYESIVLFRFDVPERVE
ncbi:sialidase family protein [Pelagicoccus mobilis]|uniref:exo-alpha-sialidase n=1 Tax=Pelagicoccus mobilis TaxID=415221 RepID=A0A934RXG5_9BACT|nr:sialidase family protein [Pelagicoccus mobilis]MBK1876147.1 exo-alpha-sialidase [Pelagicoccus mobilis]